MYYFILLFYIKENSNFPFIMKFFSIQNILTKQSIERQHDEEKLKKLLNDLGKLRQDMANPNDLDP